MATQVKTRNEVTVGKTTLVAEPGKQEVVVTRAFDYPRERMFKVMTEPKLVPAWWGPAYLKTTVEKMDVRPGGSWRFIHTEPGGKEHPFHGVYHQVKAPERLVYTFEYENVPGHVALETVTLEDLGGKTLLRDQMVFQSVEDRDGMVQSGMEEGNRELLDRLDALLAKM